MARGVAVLALLSGCAGPAGSPDSPRPGSVEDPAPAAGGWRALPGSPLSGRTGAVVVGAGDTAYVIGGWELLCPPTADCVIPEDISFTDGAAIDLDTGEWRRIADVPVPVQYAEAQVVSDDVYLVAGDRLLRYDPDSDVWDRLGRLPEGASAGQLLDAGGDLVVLDGSDERGGRRDFIYDTVTARWTALPDDPLPRTYDRFGVLDGDRLLLFGSPMVGPEEETATKVGAAYSFSSGEWSRLPDAPGPGFQVWGMGGRAFLNPHYSGDGAGGILDLRTDTWSPFPDGPDNASGGTDLAGLIGAEGAIYEYADGWALDTRDEGFVRIPERPGTTYDESLTAVGRRLLVFGGQDWGPLDDPADQGRLMSDAWLWTPPGG